MGKKAGIYIVISLFTVALLMLLQYNKPKEVNWFPSYVAKHKLPYGTLVFNDIMTKTFPDRVKQVYMPPFEFLNENQNLDGTYFFVNGNIPFGETELNRLLDWTSKGNTLFVAAKDFEETLLDTLNVKSASLFSNLENVRSHRHRLVHPKLDTKDGYIFRKDDYVTYFQEHDKAKMTVLGTVNNVNDHNTSDEKFFNVVKCPFGNGEVILSTFPKAFTNYFILKDNNKDYTAGLLSYIDDSRPVYMDNHHKSGKSVYTSPMYIFLNTKEFKWAYYLMLIGAVIYVVFEGKRKQRAIPLKSPLKNQTLAFTRTIADMYYEKGAQKPISEHKIIYFLDYIRSHFYLETIKRNTEFYRNLSARSSNSFEEVEALFAFIDKLENQSNVSDLELQKLNSSIEKFKAKAHGK